MIQVIALLLAVVAICFGIEIGEGKSLVLFDSKFTEIEEFKPVLDKNLNDFKVLEINQDAESIELIRNGELVVNNLIIFPTKSRNLGKNINTIQLLEYFDKGGNILSVTSPIGISESVNGFLNQLGIYPSARNHYLIDYFNNDGKDEKNVLLNNVRLLDNSKELNGIEYKNGSSAVISNNKLIFPIIQAPSTSFNKNIKVENFNDNSFWSIGSEGYLSVGFQSFKNSRLVWCGSSDLIKNEEVSEKLFNWLLKKSNVVRSTKLSHYNSVTKESFDVEPYKIGDNVTISIGFQELVNNEWIPFTSDKIQLEIKMLDPYYRISLKPSHSEGGYQYYDVNVKLPDHHGIFTFEIIPTLEKYNFISEKFVLPIRHLANNEFKKSWEINNSLVYISSAVVVVITWFAFLVLFLYSSTEDKVKKDK